ncbi:hypothetical protein B0J12DRAFT_747794 [Macrophomina phaseolina]|uniref:Exonuclease domain-containing protein n=1 Tax=Macrophomina phaseolina TaxID=35725 RepID=A0ABQ8FPB3_9PEZI|nr:hypothetical protein B0J12DRAFT_747794 [Macrophomina phaseolina]
MENEITRSTSAPPVGDGVHAHEHGPVANAWLGLRRDPTVPAPCFVTCNVTNCTTTSAVADFNAMTIRTGFPTCLEHTDVTGVMNKHRSMMVDTDKITYIFYDLELSRDGEVEQIGAHTSTGINFSAFVRTSVRTNTSPLLRSIPPMIYSVMASEPKTAILRFIEWINTQHSMSKDGDTDPNHITLVAHYGSCHDHVHLVRMMMKWDVEVPDYMLSDSLAIFKVLRGKRKNAKLSTLVTTYTPWVDHTPHDAVSDSYALRAVVMFGIPNWEKVCSTFSVSSRDFKGLVGLSMYTNSYTSMIPAAATNTDDDMDSSTSNHTA